MTAGRSAAGSGRPTAPIGAGQRSRRRSCASAASRCRSSPPAAPMPACTRCGQVAHLDLAREVAVETLRDALNHHLRPQPVVVLEAERGRATTSTPASPRACATTAIASSTGGRRWRSSAAAPGRCRAASMPRRCTRPRSVWSASTTSRASAARSARRSRRSRRSTGSTVARSGERDRDRRAGALVPAPSGAQHGRHAEAGRRGPLAGRADRRGAGGARPARPPVRPRRPAASTSSRSTI